MLEQPGENPAYMIRHLCILRFNKSQNASACNIVQKEITVTSGMLPGNVFILFHEHTTNAKACISALQNTARLSTFIYTLPVLACARMISCREETDLFIALNCTSQGHSNFYTVQQTSSTLQLILKWQLRLGRNIFNLVQGHDITNTRIYHVLIFFISIYVFVEWSYDNRRAKKYFLIE